MTVQVALIVPEAVNPVIEGGRDSQQEAPEDTEGRGLGEGTDQQRVWPSGQEEKGVQGQGGSAVVRFTD